jgi:hypothetical protein
MVFRAKNLVSKRIGAWDRLHTFSYGARSISGVYEEAGNTFIILENPPDDSGFEYTDIFSSRRCNIWCLYL